MLVSQKSRLHPRRVFPGGKALISIMGFIMLFSIEQCMQLFEIGAPWNTTIAQLNVLAFICDPSIWALDIIPIWVIFGFTWTLHQGSLKSLAFKVAKWIVWLFCGYWMLWDMTWIAFDAVARPGTFWTLYGTQYFSVIIPDTPLWLFVTVAIVGFILSFILIYTVKRNPKRLIPFVLWLFYVYLIGGIEQAVPVPIIWFIINSAVFIPAIAISFILTGNRNIRGPIQPSPAVVKMLTITWALILVALGYCIVELIYHWNDNDFGVNSWQIWLEMAELSPWGVLGAVTLARKKHPILVRVPVASFEINYRENGQPRRISGWQAVLILALSCTLIDMAIQIVANLSNFLFVLTAFEKFMYYIVAGIGEESLFRVGLCTGILSVFYISKRMRKSWVPIIVAAVVSGITWSLAHYWTYGDPISPEYNIAMMYALFIIGTVNGLFYGKTRNPLVVLIPHMLINAFAAFFSLTMSLVLI